MGGSAQEDCRAAHRRVHHGEQGRHQERREGLGESTSAPTGRPLARRPAALPHARCLRLKPLGACPPLLRSIGPHSIPRPPIIPHQTTCAEIYDTHKSCEIQYNQANWTGCGCNEITVECPAYVKGLIKDGNINAWDNKGCDGSDDCSHSKPYYITPMFWDKYATQEEDMASATATLIIALVGLCTCMACLVKILSYITQNSNAAMLQKAARMDPYIAIGVGTAITILVQSSSITTSVLTPLAASGIITLEQMLPITLGANIGTTCTGILASLVSAKVEAVQIAICHLTFNILGIIIWFGLPIPMPQPGPCSGGPEGRGVMCLQGWDYMWPVPFPYKKENGAQLQMKDIPLILARKLGFYTRTWNTFPLYYIIFMFVFVPGVLFGISSLFEGKAAYQALGWIVVIFLAYFIARVVFFLYKQDGFARVTKTMEDRQKSALFRKDLQATIQNLQAEVMALKASRGGSEL